MNVLRLLILPAILVASGCASLPNVGGMFKGSPDVKPIQVETKAIEKTKLDIPEPSPLKVKSPKWIVVTPENAEAVWKQLKDKNVDMVLFAITDEGYEELAVTFAEARNYIASQRTIILKYKEYYENPKPAPSK